MYLDFIKKANKFALNNVLSENNAFRSIEADGVVWYVDGFHALCVPARFAFVRAKQAGGVLATDILGKIVKAKEPLADTKLFYQGTNSLLKVYKSVSGIKVYIDTKYIKDFPAHALIQLYATEQKPHENAVVAKDINGETIGVIMPTMVSDAKADE